MNMKEYGKPVIVLTAICLVISMALVGTYAITKPIIDDAANAAANAARAVVLPGGDDFEKVDIQLENIVDAYRETAGLGYAITATANGYGGEMSVMVGFDDATGLISGVQVLSHKESQGIGTKVVGEQSYLDRYIGQDEALAVDGITGATYSTRGLKDALASAYAAYNELKKGA